MQVGGDDKIYYPWGFTFDDFDFNKGYQGAVTAHVKNRELIVEDEIEDEPLEVIEERIIWKILDTEKDTIGSGILMTLEKSK